MTLHRYIFNVSTDTGTSALQSGDTGKSVFGQVVQLRWNPTSVDTGGDLYVALLPKDGDTGDGFTIYSKNDCLGTNFTRFLGFPSSHIDGFDTGRGGAAHPYAAGERLRIKVLPGQAECRGRLYVYVKE
jgi:hypothetical protein